MKRVQDRGQMVFLQEVGLFNDLLLDLKKQLLNEKGGFYEYNPITMERLDECCKALAKISQYRKQGLYK